MNKTIVFISILLSLAGSSCKKEDPAPQPPAQEKGKIHAMVRAYSPVGMLCSYATVSVYAALADAQAGTPHLVQALTKSDGSGAVTIDIEPGQYYVIATWDNENGVDHTSDTAQVKNYQAGPPPSSHANGPQKVTVAKNHITNVTAVVDYKE